MFRKCTIITSVVFLFVSVFLFPTDNQQVVRVGVLDGWGAKAIVSVLSKESGIEVFQIPRVSMDLLGKCDVLVVTQQKSPALLTKDVRTLINWVNTGGGVLFFHDAVGYRSHMAMFPYVGEGFDHPKMDRVRVVKKHPITEGLKEGHIFSPGFKYDHVAIKTGQDGETLIDNEKGGAVVVAGHSGKGRVVLNGMLTGYYGTKEDSAGYENEPKGEELKILINSIYWLGKKK